MYYRVYIDVLFLVNFGMDFLILVIVNRILKYTTTYIRICLAAMVGALWVCLLLVFPFHIKLLEILFSYVLICTLMIKILAGNTSLRNTIKGIAVLYVVTFATGGLIQMLYYNTMIGYFLNTISINGFKAADVWLLAAGAVLLLPLAEFLIRIFRSTLAAKKNIYRIKLVNRGRSKTLFALVDTGNSLTDPFTGSFVNVVETGKFEGLTGQKQGCTDCGYHLIPFSSLGNENGIIPVVRIEHLYIYTGEKILDIEKPSFALYSGRLSGNRSYSAILNPLIMENSGED